ncbi:hypothetical protein BV25DRAFT_1770945, partial [Artomyces pyxidatus]
VKGRATRATIALDMERDVLVFLKDSWRVAHPGCDREGDIYRRLHEHHVPYIPEFECAGDVYSGKFCQRTVTPQYAKKPWACKAKLLIHYVHYRIALGTIGVSMKHFDSGQQVCRAIRDAAEGPLSSAYTKAGVMHRDVSDANIMFTKDRSHGLLIDWEHAVILEDGIKPQATGTWSYMSLKLQTHPYVPHELSDDLESLLYVLAY